MLTALAIAVSAAVPFLPIAVPPTVTCAPNTTFCVIEVERPPTPVEVGGPGGESDSGGDAIRRKCIVSSTGQEVPCEGPLGWFNDSDDCYWRKTDPQPPATDAIWAGHYPTGAIYSVACGTNPDGADGWVWSAAAPPGYGGTGVTPAQLAQQALARLALAGPAIRMTIQGSEMGLVGIPVWLWTEVGPTTWGPNSATAAVPGLSVTATAQARQIVWDMGDGRSETCKNPGTPYFVGGVTSPTCQHIYEQSSAGQPSEAFPVTATTTWDVTWTGGGASGALTVQRQSSATVRIGEMQVLVTQ
ncbi:hypothetical protein [Cellulomonas sp. URHD0024]|uniref:hypothetical protein n=1 Tax=Cellulomonas sp. URHD0024 TaxID=1302620 RepID=UPI0012DF22B5|nr:hypothetical protein [Cellulomonas sp. URHD0024]